MKNDNDFVKLIELLASNGFEVVEIKYTAIGEIKLKIQKN